MFIEAKSGTIRHRHRQWERLDPNDAETWTPITDPWLQSERSMHHVLEVLDRERIVRKNELRYSHAVAFPHAGRFDGQFPLNVIAGRHRGFAFLRFGARADAEHAIAEIDGVELAGRTLRAKWSDPGGKRAVFGVSVGNLPDDTHEGRLADAFAPLGRFRLKVMCGFAFVNFEERAAAERAIEAMNGKELFGRVLRVRKPDRGWAEHVRARDDARMRGDDP